MAAPLSQSQLRERNEEGKQQDINTLRFDLDSTIEDIFQGITENGKSLTSLTIVSKNLEDKHVKRIVTLCPNLNDLSIQQAGITDAALKCLTPMRLNFLSLLHCRNLNFLSVARLSKDLRETLVEPPKGQGRILLRAGEVVADDPQTADLLFAVVDNPQTADLLFNDRD